MSTQQIEPGGTEAVEHVTPLNAVL